MSTRTQVQKAYDFLALHHDPKLLVLPNIWDPLGARLLEAWGCAAVATASASVAYSLGYDDGENIGFDTMLDLIRRITASVGVPVTADVERGYADSPEAIADNMREVLRAGVVGVNIEDSTVAYGPLHDVAAQCETIQAVRAMADGEDIPLVINARIDTFLRKDSNTKEEKVSETITRAKAYLDAGADCIYPVGLGEIEALTTIRAETGALINVWASEGTAPMRELEAAGIARLSLGPNLLKATIVKMQEVVESLKDYGSYDVFTRGIMPSPQLRQYLSKGKMKQSE